MDKNSSFDKIFPGFYGFSIINKQNQKSEDDKLRFKRMS